MGGYGSGPSSWARRERVEAHRALDVNWLKREGYLVPGRQGAIRWSVDGEEVASIGLRCEADSVWLTYQYSHGGDEPESVRQTIRFVHVPCHYGGNRPLFICDGLVSGVACGRRVTKLYGAGRYFLCRHCYRLGHASQREDEVDRAHRRAQKVRGRLGDKSGGYGRLPVRPKGMWHRTYERLCDELMQAEEKADAAFEARAAELINRLNRAGDGKEFWQ